MSNDRSQLLKAYLDLDLAALSGRTGPAAFAARQLSQSILKKNVDETHVDADTRCLSLFLEMNERCRSDISMPDDVSYECFSYMRNFCAKLVHKAWNAQYTYHPSMIAELGDFGPGASRGTRHTHYLDKLCRSRLTATHQGLVDDWYRYCRGSIRFYQSEISRESKFGPPVLVQGSKLSFVPKNADISRGIATEPSLNMFFQKGLGRCLEIALLKHTGLNLKVQQGKARDLARSGSKDGRFATIDLKSASDTISMHLIRKLFPSDFVLLIERYRSPRMETTAAGTIELEMCSTMGNGFTFPLQTVIFTSVVLAAFKVLHINPIYPRGKRVGNFSVFGDDIIVPVEAYRLVVKLLSHCGFIVNETKSFSEGPFRESCGGDYYLGHHVRGVYNKSLYDPGCIYSTINLLVIWSTRHGVLLDNTIGYLKTLVKRLHIPIEGGSFEGPLSTSAGIFHFKPHGRRDKNGSYRYKLLAPEQRGIPISRYLGCEDAVVSSALKGAIRRGKVLSRDTDSHVRISEGCTPNWQTVSEKTLGIFNLTSADAWKCMCHYYWG